MNKDEVSAKVSRTLFEGILWGIIFSKISPEAAITLVIICGLNAIALTAESRKHAAKQKNEWIND